MEAIVIHIDSPFPPFFFAFSASRRRRCFSMNFQFLIMEIGIEVSPRRDMGSRMDRVSLLLFGGIRAGVQYELVGQR